ncbi:MAG: hypothetical protein K8E66_03600, partial [Phycisphaerales bacterium]|nr:hypothetical protein [Phycisphaerales bacterium]
MAAPQTSVWPVENIGEHSACAAAELSGWYAVADTGTDSIEIRDVRGVLIRQIGRAELSTLITWMTLDTSADGPSALTWTDSGRSLFISVHDNEPGSGGLGSDAIVRYDTVNDVLTLFARAEISDEVSVSPHPALAHFRGRLYVGTEFGTLQIHRAERNDTSSLFPTTVSMNGPVRGLAIDRGLNLIYAATDTALRRASLAIDPPVFAEVGPLDGARAITHSDHFGGATTWGLFVLDRAGTRVLRVPNLQAIGLQTFDPETYLSPADEWHDLDATACGRLLATGDAGAAMIADDTDTRLLFEAWVADEFAQVVAFCKSLISPDGEPAGWVIDGDVSPGGTRFHPATPDGAAWVVMALLMNDHL